MSLAPRLFSVSHKILCLSRYCWWNKAVLSSYFLEQLRMFGFVGIMRELSSLVTEQWNNTCPIDSNGWSHSIQWVFSGLFPFRWRFRGICCVLSWKNGCCLTHINKYRTRRNEQFFFNSEHSISVCSVTREESSLYIPTKT